MPSPRIRISAAEAAQKGLAPLGISVDLSATPLEAMKFPADDELLTLSGPPGGPLFVDVYSYTSTKHDAPALEGMVRKRFGQPHLAPLALGKAATIELAGAKRVALGFTFGDELGASTACAALLPTPVGGSAGLLVVFGHGGLATGAIDCAKVAAHPDLAKALASLRLEP